jgi:hypothetical protein
MGPPAISIWNINLARPGGKADFHRRLGNIATLVAQKDNTRGKQGDIFALIETFYNKSGWWTKRFDPAKITCSSGGDSKDVWTAECFFDKWKTALSGRVGGTPVHQQFGDVAYLTHDGVLTPLGQPFKKELGSSGWWEQLRYAVGNRFRISNGGQILPFYAAHISPTRSRQYEQCRQLISFVKNNFVAGDLTPVIVGDFNFRDIESYFSIDLGPGVFNPADWTIVSSPQRNPSYLLLDQSFVEVAHLVGNNTIEHCWIGRSSAFPNNGGVMSLSLNSFELNPDFNDEVENLSDHPAPYLQLTLRMVNAPPS